MEFDRYRDAVAANRRKHGFDAVDKGGSGFDPLWRTRDSDPTVGDVSVFATVVDGSGYDADDLIDTADRFRAVVARRTDDHADSVTRIGYVVIAVADPDPDLLSTAASYVVAERRSNVFPIVYDLEEEAVHTHAVPRLKGRGIYRRQVDDAEQLFEV